MTRRTRSAALFTVTAMTGLALSLAIAPTANAVDIPTLGDLTYSPSTPALGDTLKASGTGCLGNLPGTTATAGAATSADDPVISSSVAVTLTLDGDFYSSDTASPSPDGSWDANGILLGDAGDYTLSATCTISVAGSDSTSSYGDQTFTVDAPTPPAVPDPTVSCIGCAGVNPGSSVTLSGLNFPAGPVTVALSGYASQTAQAKADGSVSAVSFVIRADQAAGTLSGSVTASTGAPVAFQVVVVVPQDGNADGTVPPVTTTTPTTTTGTGSNSSTTRSGGTSSTSSKPSLPATGTDSLWPGVIGASLLVAGAGLVWAGRRRPERVDAAV